MNLINLIDCVSNKRNFDSLDGFIEFSLRYLEYIDKGIQAKIISQNENNYFFMQYDNWGSYQITRPINSELYLSLEELEKNCELFLEILNSIRLISKDDIQSRVMTNKIVYTMQQCIGAALDALPPGQSNKARKINGDLFEQMIRLIFRKIGIVCNAGIVRVPIKVDDIASFNMNYQHDLIVERNGQIKVLGTIKTSSKDRLDKIFIDKFLYSKLTNTSTPHIAIILNDIQRKKSRLENTYGVNATFLPGHFKGYTIKLNPLDGVYYCDIRPNMKSDRILKEHIKTFDHLIFQDIWNFI